jgi:hypothetical protein
MASNFQYDNKSCSNNCNTQIVWSIHKIQIKNYGRFACLKFVTLILCMEKTWYFITHQNQKGLAS